MYIDRTREKHDSSFSIVICIADCKIFLKFYLTIKFTNICTLCCMSRFKNVNS